MDDLIQKRFMERELALRRFLDNPSGFLKELRLLIIEDSKFDFLLIKQILKRIQGVKIRLEHVSTLEDGLNHVKTKEYDLILYDILLNGKIRIEGIDSIRRLKPWVGIIVVSDIEEDDVLLEILRKRVPIIIKTEKLPTSLVNVLYEFMLQQVEKQMVLEKVRNELSLDRTATLIFKVAGTGMVIHHKNLTAVKDKIQNEEAEFLQKTALYYVIGVGQGESYHTGLFVLPVNELKDHVSLTFAVRLHDQESDDERLQEGYFLFNYFIRKELLHELPPLPWLEHTFFQVIKRNVTDATELTEKRIKQIHSLFFDRVLFYLRTVKL